MGNNSDAFEKWMQRFYGDPIARIMFTETDMAAAWNAGIDIEVQRRVKVSRPKSWASSQEEE